MKSALSTVQPAVAPMDPHAVVAAPAALPGHARNGVRLEIPASAVGTEGEERLPRSACDSLQQQPEAILQRANVEQDRRVGACARLSYDVLLEHIAQPSFGVDRYGVVNHWNRALERFCGIQAADAIGNPLATLLAPVLLERLAPALHAVQTPYSAERWDAPLILSGLLPIVRSENGPVTAQRILLLPRIYLPGCLDGFVALIEPTMDGPQQAG